MILLNLYFYSQSHSSRWLLLDGVFAGILGVRAWQAFGSGQKDEQKIRREMDPCAARTHTPRDDPPAVPGDRFRF